MIILSFERRFSKQNSVIRLKSYTLPPQIFGLATPLLGMSAVPRLGKKGLIKCHMSA